MVLVNAANNAIRTWHKTTTKHQSKTKPRGYLLIAKPARRKYDFAKNYRKYELDDSKQIVYREALFIINQFISDTYKSSQ